MAEIKNRDFEIVLKMLNGIEVKISKSSMADYYEYFSGLSSSIDINEFYSDLMCQVAICQLKMYEKSLKEIE